jgi:hypothetical protein
MPLDFAPLRRMSAAAAIAFVVGAGFTPSASGQAAAQARGGFRVAGYGAVQNAEVATFRDYVRGERMLEGWAESLNAWINLPRNVGLSFGECGQANAYYDPQQSLIKMCYELLRELSTAFEENSEEPMTDEEHTEALLGATDFIFYHELGHALLDVLELPTLGRNEDAADGLAAYILIDAEDEDDEGGELSAVRGVEGLIGLRGDQELTELDFAGEHSLSEQRFYNVMCFIYGSDPQAYAELVTEGTLPTSRAARCEEEYRTLNRDWERLLRRWLKESN